VDAAHARDEAENAYYEAAGDPDFVPLETTPRWSGVSTCGVFDA
jgi:hypothetical protein